MGKQNKKFIRTWCEKFSYIVKLGDGGNAEVYKVCDKATQEFYALKELKKDHLGAENRARFINEINIMMNLGKDFVGVVPIIIANEQEFWYVMPVAQPIMNRLKEISTSYLCRIKELKKAFIDLSETLVELQAIGISHRDIKPDNLYYYNGRYCYGDFGLVDFPNNELDLTATKRTVGAKFTVAPEMRRYPKEADGLKADIYSLAKTFWILLTGDDKAFEGKYNALDVTHSFRFNKELKAFHLLELEDLIADSTDNDPDQRPTAEIFLTRIKEWIQISEEFQRCQLSEWNEIERLIFGGIVPETAVWKNAKDIVNVLNCISVMPVYNHMLYSGHGGLDFVHAALSPEPGWVDIMVRPGCINRIFPRELRFEGFEEKIEWNYFLLSLEEKKPIFHIDDDNFESELIIEDYPNHYIYCPDFDYGVYDYDSGIPLPESAIKIRRFCSGTIMFVMKMGPYNGIHLTYDGRHGDCRPTEFRDYILWLIRIQNEAIKKKIDPMVILNSNAVSANPFKQQIEDEMDDYYKEELINNLINSKIKTWKFPCAVNSIDSNNSSKICYYIRFQPCGLRSIEDIMTRSISYINNQYYISISENGSGISNSLLFDSMHSASIYLNKLKEFIVSKCNENGLDLPEYGINPFDVGIRKGSEPPVHLFTKQEIKTIMTKADDRRNNVLVVDEDGFVHIISNMEEVSFYPVRLEVWNARSHSVGKYSDLDNLDDVYLCALNGWSMYLETGNSYIAEYSYIKDEKELIRHIKEYM